MRDPSTPCLFSVSWCLPASNLIIQICFAFSTRTSLLSRHSGISLRRSGRCACLTYTYPPPSPHHHLPRRRRPSLALKFSVVAPALSSLLAAVTPINAVAKSNTKRVNLLSAVKNGFKGVSIPTIKIRRSNDFLCFLRPCCCHATHFAHDHHDIGPVQSSCSSLFGVVIITRAHPSCVKAE